MIIIPACNPHVYMGGKYGARIQLRRDVMFTGAHREGARMCFYVPPAINWRFNPERAGRRRHNNFERRDQRQRKPVAESSTLARGGEYISRACKSGSTHSRGILTCGEVATGNAPGNFD